MTVKVTGNTAYDVLVHPLRPVHMLGGGWCWKLTFEAPMRGVFGIGLEGSQILLIRLKVS